MSSPVVDWRDSACRSYPSQRRRMTTEHGAIQAANTALFGTHAGWKLGPALRGLWLCPRVTFAKTPRLIPKNLKIPEAGAGAVRVLEKAASK